MPRRMPRKAAKSVSGGFSLPLKKKKKQAWLNRNRSFYEFVMKRGKKWPDYGEVGHPSGASSLGFNESYFFSDSLVSRLFADIGRLARGTANVLELAGMRKKVLKGEEEPPSGGFHEFRSKRDYKKNLRNTNRTPHAIKGRKKKRPPRRMALRARKKFSDWHDWFPDEKTTKREWKSWYPDDKGRPPAGNFWEFKSPYDVSKNTVKPYSIQRKQQNLSKSKPYNWRTDPQNKSHWQKQNKVNSNTRSGYAGQRIPDYFDYSKNPKTALALDAAMMLTPVGWAAKAGRAAYAGSKALRGLSAARKTSAAMKVSKELGPRVRGGSNVARAKAVEGSTRFNKAASKTARMGRGSGGRTPLMDRARNIVAGRKAKEISKTAKKTGKAGIGSKIGGVVKGSGRFYLMNKGLDVASRILGGGRSERAGGLRESNLA